MAQRRQPLSVQLDRCNAVEVAELKIQRDGLTAQIQKRGAGEGCKYLEVVKSAYISCDLDVSISYLLFKKLSCLKDMKREQVV